MLAWVGILPQLLKIKSPKRPTCRQSTTRKIPWRAKGNHSKMNCKTCSRGRLTKDRYTYATECVDQSSRRSYISRQRSTSSN